MTDDARPTPTRRTIAPMPYSQPMLRSSRPALLGVLVGLGLGLDAGCGGGLGAPSPVAVAALGQTIPPVGAAAPAGTLTAADGHQVELGDRWSSADRTVVVFYRGFF